MGYSEFPHATYMDGDMTEFINLYKELLSKYSGTLEEIKSLSHRLDVYETTMDDNIKNITNVIVPNAVSSAVEQAMNEYRVQLENLQYKVTKLEEALQTSYNTLNTKISETEQRLISDYTLRIEQLRTSMTNMIEELDHKIDSINESLLSEINKTNESLLSEINKTKDELNQRITSVDSASRVRDLAVEERLETYLEEELKKMQSEIDSLTPQSDKERVKWLWDNGCNFGGYSALQWFRDTRITAQEWASKKFTCVDWYVRGREVFRWFDRSRYIYSPITGRLESVQKVVVDLCTFLKINAITAGEYDALMLTAEEYDNKKLSALEYDWRGKEILNV